TVAAGLLAPPAEQVRPPSLSHPAPHPVPETLGKGELQARQLQRAGHADRGGLTFPPVPPADRLMVRAEEPLALPRAGGAGPVRPHPALRSISSPQRRNVAPNAITYSATPPAAAVMSASTVKAIAAAAATRASEKARTCLAFMSVHSQGFSKGGRKV